MINATVLPYRHFGMRHRCLAMYASILILLLVLAIKNKQSYRNGTLYSQGLSPKQCLSEENGDLNNIVRVCGQSNVCDPRLLLLCATCYQQCNSKVG